MLAFCAVPEVIRTVKDKRCHVGWGLLLMWYLGEIFVFYHVLINIGDKPLLFNYLLNIILISVMVYYKLTAKKISGKVKQPIGEEYL